MTMDMVDYVKGQAQLSLKKVQGNEGSSMEESWVESQKREIPSGEERPAKRRMTVSENMLGNFGTHPTISDNNMSPMKYTTVDNDQRNQRMLKSNQLTLAGMATSGYEYKQFVDNSMLDKTPSINPLNLNSKEFISYQNDLSHDNLFNSYQQKANPSYESVFTYNLDLNKADNNISPKMNMPSLNMDLIKNNVQLLQSPNSATLVADYMNMFNDHKSPMPMNFSVIPSTRFSNKMNTMEQIIENNLLLDQNDEVGLKNMDIKVENDQNSQFFSFATPETLPSTAFPKLSKNSSNSIDVHADGSNDMNFNFDQIQPPKRRRADTMLETSNHPSSSSNIYTHKRKHAASLSLLDRQYYFANAAVEMQSNDIINMMFDPQNQRPVDAISSAGTEGDHVDSFHKPSRKNSMSQSSIAGLSKFEMSKNPGFGTINNMGGDKMVMIFTAKVAQKSYGTEKRFLCPPPVMLFFGKGKSFMCECPSENNHTSEKKLYQDKMPKVLVGISGMEVNGVNVNIPAEAIYSNQNNSDSDKPNSAISSNLDGCLNTPNARHAAQLEWLVDSRERTQTVGYPGNQNNDFKLRGRCVAKNLFINDSDDKNKKVHVSVRLVDNHTNSQFVELYSKPIKVISKPSKKRQSVRNVDLCIHHGSVISLFNRFRSQTVSTKYLGVNNSMTSGGKIPEWCYSQDTNNINNVNSNETPCFVARSSVWDLFIIWVVDPYALSNNATVNGGEDAGPAIPGYPTPPLVALRPRVPPNFVYNSPSNVGNVQSDTMDPLKDAQSGSGGTRSHKSTPIAIHYNQPIVLQCLSTGMVSPVMVLRKIERNSIASGAFYMHGSQCVALGDPVSQLHKVAFELHRQHCPSNPTSNIMDSGFNQSRSLGNNQHEGLSHGQYLTFSSDYVGFQYSVSGKTVSRPSSNSQSFEKPQKANPSAFEFFNNNPNVQNYNSPIIFQQNKGPYEIPNFYNNTPSSAGSAGNFILHSNKFGQTGVLNPTNNLNNDVMGMTPNHHGSAGTDPKANRRRANSSIDVMSGNLFMSRSSIFAKSVQAAQVVWSENVGDPAVWTIVGTDCATYRFDYPDENSGNLSHLDKEEPALPHNDDNKLYLPSNTLPSSGVEFSATNSGIPSNLMMDLNSQNALLDEFNSMTSPNPSKMMNSVIYNPNSKHTTNNLGEKSDINTTSPAVNRLYAKNAQPFPENDANVLYYSSSHLGNAMGDNLNQINNFVDSFQIQQGSSLMNKLGLGGMVGSIGVNGAGQMMSAQDLYNIYPTSLDNNGKIVNGPVVYSIEIHNANPNFLLTSRSRGLSLNSNFIGLGLSDQQGLTQGGDNSSNNASPKANSVNGNNNQNQPTPQQDFNSFRLSLTINGDNFSPDLKVYFDRIPSLSVEYKSPKQIICLGPVLNDFQKSQDGADNLNQGKNQISDSSGLKALAPFDVFISLVSENGTVYKTSHKFSVFQ